ncbi:MAG TPA: hypothetical protein VNO55_05310 [Polyangia bacterium]|nr:hypothetical protein [Polyangia bacterium]
MHRQNLDVPRPGLLYKILRDSHPPLGERIDFINAYRPRRQRAQTLELTVPACRCLPI